MTRQEIKDQLLALSLLQDYPHITAADLVNAWAYADHWCQVKLNMAYWLGSQPAPK